MITKINLLTIFILFINGLSPLSAQEDERYVPETDPLVLQKLEQWQDLKFGLLMHWGTYSQWGIVESWSICSEDEPWCRRNNTNYVEYKRDYENLQTTFNPVDFDPVRWAKAARNAGMKYVVFTTKHHDGFSMFDTKLTDYRITSPKTPFHTNPKANIAKEVFNAFRAEDLWAGAYFSKPDWHSEYYWWPNFATPDRNPNYDISKYPERWENFVQFTQGQIMELVGGDYGKLDILWLDGGQVQKLNEEDVYRNIERVQKMSKEEMYKYLTSSGYKFTKIQSQDIHMDELVAKVREKQPGMIVVDRAVYGKNQNYLTPENRVPEHALPYPWESCIVAGQSWSWVPDAKYISSTEAVHMLVDIVIKGGNLLLNIGPGPQGQWHEEAYKLLDDIGKWMNVNGEAIYGTRALSPFKEGKVCISKKGDNTIYIYYLADDGEKMPSQVEMTTFSLPKGARISIVGTGTSLKWSKTEKGFSISIPEKLRNKPPSKYVWVMKASF
ncbi:MAG: alpha-L-fucosidase [Bacteroidetes bacterium GWE2_41_25]|nr:MAG: alpha-L-fucosidase [Bacteroidetes bacterium GWA2_40_15]OFX92599.1 MAG: alpha-L-fucosidase [Bacteroidetes bacterium GWE2_41_25]HBH83543.1 alpha-L-fucosidase [Bacteroidales bacterium]